jgi:hypothetical protein
MVLMVVEQSDAKKQVRLQSTLLLNLRHEKLQWVGLLPNWFATLLPTGILRKS